MLNKRLLALTISFLFFKTVLLYSQVENESDYFSKEDIILLTEKKYGPDDLLINGEKYRPDDIRVNGDLFFEWDESFKTELHIKGQVYLGIDLKYDINSDKLILTKATKDAYKRVIVLSPSRVDSFYLGQHFFILLDKQKLNFEKDGYFEKIYSGKDILLKKYSKSIIKIYDDYNPNGKYSSQKYTYYIYNSKGLVKVNSKKAFLKFYDTFRKEIGKFMKTNGIVYKNANNEELIKLMTFCHAKTTQAN